MNAIETSKTLELITGYWPIGDQRAAGIAKWINERGVEFPSAKKALAELAEQYDQAPSIKQLGVKLAEIGASTRADIGVGDVRVIASMKSRIVPLAKEAAERRRQSYLERLREEQAAAREYHDDAVSCDLGSDGYYRDMLTAYAELIAQEMGQ